MGGLRRWINRTLRRGASEPTAGAPDPGAGEPVRAEGRARPFRCEGGDGRCPGADHHRRVHQPRIDQTFSAEDVAAYYDDWNERYEAVFGDVFQHLKATDHDELLGHMAEVAGIADGQSLVDAGCGIVGPARHFARRHRRAHRCRHGVPGPGAAGPGAGGRDAGLDDRITRACGGLPPPRRGGGARSVDLVYFLEALVHAHDPAQACGPAFAVLGPGGRLYVKDFYRGRSDDPAAQRVIDECVEATNRICHLTIRNTEDVLGWVAEAGFTVEVSRAARRARLLHRGWPRVLPPLRPRRRRRVATSPPPSTSTTWRSWRASRPRSRPGLHAGVAGPVWRATPAVKRSRVIDPGGRADHGG